ncbi:hypothetical protein PG994_013488 [Apiospora phragmitis]|uniref:Uncharacterized protein n=1 Tax=Apiospora phragmitis TaxID=2905665 RepID=A0ABR1T8T8_9PEZI
MNPHDATVGSDSPSSVLNVASGVAGLVLVLNEKPQLPRQWLLQLLRRDILLVGVETTTILAYFANCLRNNFAIPKLAMRVAMACGGGNSFLVAPELRGFCRFWRRECAASKYLSTLVLAG